MSGVYTGRSMTEQRSTMLTLQASVCPGEDQTRFAAPGPIHVWVSI